MNPPPRDDDPIITQFQPANGQWELTDEKLKFISPWSGGTILHNYCIYINTTPLEVFRYLIETNGLDINAQDNSTVTPIQNALEEFNPNIGGDIAVLTYLLSREDIDAKTPVLGLNLIQWACYNPNTLPINIFKLLVEKLGCDVNVQDDFDETPAHNLLNKLNPSRGDSYILSLSYLLDQQQNHYLSVQDRYGQTSLHLACLDDLSGSEDDDIDYPKPIDEVNDHTDTYWSQVVEIIVERYLRLVFEETTL
jgi:ankyrin repeat protein